MLTTTTEHLTRLMAWLSPTFPIGGYTYSHGIEYAVESGHVLNRADLVRWAEAILKHGAGRTDAVLFAAAYRAVEANDEATFELGGGAGGCPARQQRVGVGKYGAGHGVPVHGGQHVAA